MRPWLQYIITFVCPAVVFFMCVCVAWLPEGMTSAM